MKVTEYVLPMKEWAGSVVSWLAKQLTHLHSTTTISQLLLIYLPLSLISYLSYRIVYYRYFHPLSHIPGPFWESISTLFRVHKMGKGTINLHERELHRKYGSVVRVGPNLLSSWDPRHIPLIHHSKVDKPAFLDLPGLGLEYGIVSLRDHKEHQWKKRRLMNPVSFQVPQKVNAGGC